MINNQTASAINAAVAALRSETVARAATAEDMRGMILLPSQCHLNARIFAAAKGVEAIRGWMICGQVYLTHSIVMWQNELLEVTPGVSVPYTFVPATNAPDALWDERVAQLIHIPDGSCPLSTDTVC